MLGAVCLDLGGTLVDRERHADLVEYWRRLGVGVHPDAAAAALYRADHHFMRHLPALWQNPDAAFHACYWPIVHEELCLPPPAPEVCAAWGGPWRRYPDVLPAVQAVRRAGLRLALISNWDATGPAVLRATGLADAFDVVTFSEAEGCAKPSPWIFVHSARRLGLSPGDCLHVGDNPSDDVEGALGAGMRAALLHRRPGWSAVPQVPPGVAVVATLHDLGPLLAGLLSLPQAGAVGIA